MFNHNSFSATSFNAVSWRFDLREQTITYARVAAHVRTGQTVVFAYSQESLRASCSVQDPCVSARVLRQNHVVVEADRAVTVKAAKPPVKSAHGASRKTAPPSRPKRPTTAFQIPTFTTVSSKEITVFVAHQPDLAVVKAATQSATATLK